MCELKINQLASSPSDIIFSLVHGTFDKMLLPKTALEKTDMDGNTALHLAVKQNLTPDLIGRLVMPHNVTMRNAHGHTALHLIICYNLPVDTLRHLVTPLAAACDIQDIGGNTPLHLALAMGAETSVLLLLSHTDTSQRNTYGVTPLQLLSLMPLTFHFPGRFLSVRDALHLVPSCPQLTDLSWILDKGLATSEKQTDLLIHCLPRLRPNQLQLWDIDNERGSGVFVDISGLLLGPITMDEALCMLGAILDAGCSIADEARLHLSMDDDWFASSMSVTEEAIAKEIECIWAAVRAEPRPLLQLCRNKVRSDVTMLSNKCFDQLDLPHRLRDFVALAEMDRMENK